MAEQFDARLIGIASCQPQPSAYVDGTFAQSLVQKLEIDGEEKLCALERRFKTAFQNRVKDIEWRSTFASPTDYVAREARSADLVITGPKRGGEYIDPLWRLDPSELVMVGCPVEIPSPRDSSRFSTAYFLCNVRNGGAIGSGLGVVRSIEWHRAQ